MEKSMHGNGNGNGEMKKKEEAHQYSNSVEMDDTVKQPNGKGKSITNGNTTESAMT